MQIYIQVAIETIFLVFILAGLTYLVQKFLLRLLTHSGSIDCLSVRLKIQSELARGILLSLGFAVPDLANNFYSSFSRKEMINYGFGVVVGSGIFGFAFDLVFTLCLGIGSIYSFNHHKVSLRFQVFPLMRDYSVFLLTLLYIIFISRNLNVNIYSSVGLTLLYPLYIVISLLLKNKFHEDFEYRTVDTNSQKEGFDYNEETFNKEEKLEEVDFLILNPKKESLKIKNDNSYSNKINGNEENEEKSENESEIQDHIQNVSIATENSQSFFVKFYHFFRFPWKFLFKNTIFPENCPILAFLTIILYVSFLVFFIVEYVDNIADLVNISHAFIGLTLSAVALNIIEILNFIVAIQAKRIELGTTSLIGSQILNLHLALGLPWSIKILLEGNLQITEMAIEYALWASFAIIILSLLVVALNNFKLTIMNGVLLIFLYFFYFGIQLNGLVLKSIKVVK